MSVVAINLLLRFSPSLPHKKQQRAAQSAFKLIVTALHKEYAPIADTITLPPDCIHIKKQCSLVPRSIADVKRHFKLN